MFRKICLSALLLFSFFAQTQAQETNNDPEPIAPDRPGIGEAINTVPKGAFQAEIGLTPEWASTENSRYRGLYWNQTTLRYGILDKTELRLGFDVQRVRNEVFLPNDTLTTQFTGLKPWVLGFKTRFVDNEGWRPAISFLANFFIPLGAREEFKTEHLAPNLRLTFENSITDWFAISYNAGIAWNGNDAVTSPFYTVSLDFALSEKWFAFAEGFGQFYADGSPSEHGINVGVMFRPIHNLQFDLSYGTQFKDFLSDNFLSIGASWLFNPKKN